MSWVQRRRVRNHVRRDAVHDAFSVNPAMGSAVGSHHPSPSIFARLCCISFPILPFEVAQTNDRPMRFSVTLPECIFGALFWESVSVYSDSGFNPRLQRCPCSEEVRRLHRAVSTLQNNDRSKTPQTESAKPENTTKCQADCLETQVQVSAV